MQTYRYNSALKRALIVDIEAGKELMVVNKLNGRKTTIDFFKDKKTLKYHAKRFLLFIPNQLMVGVVQR